MCKYELPTWKLSKVIVWHTHTYTHTETDKCPWNYIPCRFAGGQHQQQFNLFLTIVIIISVTGFVFGILGSGDGFLCDDLDVLERLGAVRLTFTLQAPRRSFALTFEQHVDEVRHFPRRHHDVRCGLRCRRRGTEIVFDLSVYGRLLSADRWRAVCGNRFSIGGWL